LLTRSLPRLRPILLPLFLALLLLASLLLGSLTLPGSTRIVILLGAFAVPILVVALLLRPGMDASLFLAALALSGLGLLANHRLRPDLAALQTSWAIMGMLLFLLLLILLRDVTVLSRYKYIWATAGLLLLVSTFAFGVERGGSKLWLAIGPYTIQPSEFAKVLLALFFAAYLTPLGAAIGPSLSRGGPGAYKTILGPMALVWCGVLVLFLLVRDLGTPVILFAAFVAVWYAATARRGLALFAAAAFSGGLYWASHLFPYVMNRFVGWVDPWDTINTAGHHVAMSLFSVAEGGILGQGLGLGQPNLVPAANTDFIFDVFAEELGLVGGAAIIILSAYLAFLYFRTALRTSDTFARLLAVGLGAEVSIQAIVILGGNLRALPITGVTLPFVSRGGSSLISSFLALGLVTAISRLPTRGSTLLTTLSLSKGRSISPLASGGSSAWERQQLPLDRAVAIISREILLCFLGLALLHFYWGAVAAPRLAMHPSNPHARARNVWAEKGRILDRSGTVLVESRRTPEGYLRAYPQGEEEFVHIAGYDSHIYGQTGIEKAFLMQLLGAPRYLHVGWNGVEAGFSPADVQLTVDARLQRLSQQLLGERLGAVVLLDPKTGEILALASSPSFSPSGLEEQWDKLVKNPDKPFINRAVAGLYPPGSTFKVFTLSSALTYGVVSDSDRFTCQGEETVAGGPVPCHKKGGHGEISLRTAFTQSCNIAFAKMGLRLGAERFEKMAEQFFLDRRFALPLATSRPRVPKGNDMTPSMLAECSFGQGALQITPLHMTMIAAAVANGGVMAKPHLVKKVMGPNGSETFAPEVLSRPLSRETAQKVTDLMVAAVEEGTGRRARISGVKVAGKTGSAENPPHKPHSWFVGFAPADSPQFAFGVIVENGGTGGSAATPIARQLLLAALGR